MFNGPKMNRIDMSNQDPDMTSILLDEARRTAHALRGEVHALGQENIALHGALEGVPGVAEDVSRVLANEVIISPYQEGRKALDKAVQRRALAGEVAKGFAALVGEYTETNSEALQAAAVVELRSKPDLQREVEEAARVHALEQVMGQATTARAVELVHEHELVIARREAFVGLGVDMDSLAPKTKVTVRLGEYHDADQTAARIARTVEFIAHGKSEFEVVADTGTEARYTIGELVLLGRQITRKGESQFRPTVRAGAELCVDRDSAQPGHEIVAGGQVVDMSIDGQPLRGVQEVTPPIPTAPIAGPRTASWVQPPTSWGDTAASGAGKTYEDERAPKSDIEDVLDNFNNRRVVDVTGLSRNTTVELWLGRRDDEQKGARTRIKHRIHARALDDGRFYLYDLDGLKSRPERDSDSSPWGTHGLRFGAFVQSNAHERLLRGALVLVASGAETPEFGWLKASEPLDSRLVLQNIVVGNMSARPAEDFSFVN